MVYQPETFLTFLLLRGTRCFNLTDCIGQTLIIVSIILIRTIITHIIVYRSRSAYPSSSLAMVSEILAVTGLRRKLDFILFLLLILLLCLCVISSVFLDSIRTVLLQLLLILLFFTT